LKFTLPHVFTICLLLIFSTSVISQNIEYKEFELGYTGASNFNSLNAVETAIRRCRTHGGFRKLNPIIGHPLSYGYPAYTVSCNEVHGPNGITVQPYCRLPWSKGPDYCYRYSDKADRATDAGLPSCEEKAGNPINLATGRKYQIEVDYVSAANPLLKIERHYNSHSPTIFR